MFLIFLLCLFVILFVYWYIHYKKYEDIRKLPGPPGHPIFGHMLQLNRDIDDTFEKVLSLNQIYGPVVKIWSNPFKPSLVVADAKYVEVLLTTNSHLDKSDAYKCFYPFLGNSLVIAKAEVWKKQRKLLNPAFNTKILENFVPVFEYHGNKFIELLKEHVSEPNFDIIPLMDLYALDIILDSIMRTRTDFLHKADTEYLQARNGFLHVFMCRMYSYIRQQDILFWFSPLYNVQAKCAHKLRQFAKDNVLKRKAEIKERAAESCVKVNGRKQVLVNLLLDSNVMNDDEIVDQINMFVVAGHDTPASALAFALFEIAKYPEIQNKILEESIAITGKNKYAEITFQDMQQMKYLECVIKETMRYHTTLPFFDRKTEADIVIDGVKIPKGTDISICAYNLHRDKRYFKNPDKFDPDRFLPENANEILPNTYIPFSSGPRNCIGKSFSMLLMKSSIAKIVRNFELHAVSHEHKLKLTSEFVLKARNGLPIELTIRRM